MGETDGRDFSMYRIHLRIAENRELELHSMRSWYGNKKGEPEGSPF
jgi:hypothetical protein